MTTTQRPRVAIVDYSLGNLFSVKNACQLVGLDAFITSEKSEILAADAVMLPGVGAFGDAMDCLHKRDLVAPLRDIAQSDKLLVGICLGQQLLMSESFEFGRHKGLDIIEGSVIRFDNPTGPQGPLKVPQVGWNHVYPPARSNPMNRVTTNEEADRWRGTPLENITPGEFMYFVHSFYVQPASADVILSVTQYGHIEFCSGLHKGNVISFQFHPERSGVAGMQVYRYISASLYQQIGIKEIRHAA